MTENPQPICKHICNSHKPSIDQKLQKSLQSQHTDERKKKTKTSPTAWPQIQRVIDHTEKKIDELVYGLYGLSAEEIGIAE